MAYSEVDHELALMQAFTDGYKRGYDIGVETGKVDNAKTALSMDFSIEIISKITGIDEKVVVEIKNRLPK
ncbi:MAG: hypothetical protein LBT38_05315 [Deltaproteobacteria bacterium]|jgi:hypothetical protein|nr:hypothetical protein [Deltaproteobacteria bacterium]